MLIIGREQLIIKDRQRKRIDTGPLNELKESIKAKGLLHPPAAFPIGNGNYLLVAGERRTRATELLDKENCTYLCNGMEVPRGKLPITLCDLGTETARKEAEFDENVIRQELTWQERAQALAEIHNLRRLANPAQTFTDTAREIAEKGGAGNLQSADYGRTAIREAILVTEHLDDPAIAAARNFREAHALVLKKEEERVNAILAQRRIAALPTTPDIEVRAGDLEDILPTLEAGKFDLVVADPPYGIDAGSGGFRSRTIHHHNYQDDEATARKLALCILTEGFRVTKFRANLFLFTDIKHWDWLQRVSAQIGWTPFRRPLIWGKSDSEGLAPWGAQGPRITTEFIFFATRGEKGLLASPIDYIRVNRVPRNERIHAAEKPVELIRKLLECSTLPGDVVLDPCCGSGSTLVACKELGRRALGIEKDPNYFNTAMSNVHGGGKAA
jgi:site-specific DNA-methyltransferase (adenine-specific)